MNQSVLIVVSAVLLIAIIAITASRAGVANRMRKKGRTTRQRESDANKLTKHQRKILLQSKDLIAQNRFLQAARLLESIHLEREAISLLEKSGNIHEACQILLRLRRPNRAGVLYARNKYFTNAAECFHKADMPLEAAQCARSAGEHAMAAHFFYQASEYGEAAQSYVETNDLLRAARCYFKSGQIDSSMASYKKKFGNQPKENFKSLTTEDLSNIKSWLGSGHFDDCIGMIAQKTGVLAEVIHTCSQNADLQNLVSLLPLCSSEELEEMLANIDYSSKAAETLASGLSMSKIYKYAGMIFEQIDFFEQAAENFSLHGDHQRSSFLWDRAGNFENAQLERSKAIDSPHAIEISDPMSGSFSLTAASNYHEAPVKPAKEQQKIALNANTNLPTFSTELSGDKNHSIFSLDISKSNNNNDKSASADDEKLYLQKKDADKIDRRVLPSIDLEIDHSSRYSMEFDRNTVEEKTSGSSIPKVFYQAGLWVDLTGPECEKIWNLGETISFVAGDIVETAKETSKGLYIVLTGSVKAEVKTADKVNIVAYPPGDYFGESAILGDTSSENKYMVPEHTTLYLIKREDFEGLLESDGVIGRKVYKTFTNRLLNKLSDQKKPKDSRRVS